MLTLQIMHLIMEVNVEVIMQAILHNINGEVIFLNFQEYKLSQFINNYKSVEYLINLQYCTNTHPLMLQSLCFRPTMSRGAIVILYLLPNLKQYMILPQPPLTNWTTNLVCRTVLMSTLTPRRRTTLMNIRDRRKYKIENLI